MDAATSLEVRSLMARFRAGDHMAAGALVHHFYPELRRIASARMRRESSDHTWTPTALVNELYLELVKIRALRDAAADSDERDAFLRLAGYIMRRLLIHHSRPLYRKAQKLDAGVLEQQPSEVSGTGVEALAEVENVLNRLGKINPRLRAVVEMRVFEGRTVLEIGGVLGCSERTVQTQWSFAKRWLEKELRERGESG